MHSRTDANLRGHNSRRIVPPLLSLFFLRCLFESLTTEPDPSSEIQMLLLLLVVLVLVMAMGEEGFWRNPFERSDPSSIAYKNWVVSFFFYVVIFLFF